MKPWPTTHAHTHTHTYYTILLLVFTQDSTRRCWRWCLALVKSLERTNADNWSGSVFAALAFDPRRLLFTLGVDELRDAAVLVHHFGKQSAAFAVVRLDQLGDFSEFLFVVFLEELFNCRRKIRVAHQLRVWGPSTLSVGCCSDATGHTPTLPMTRAAGSTFTATAAAFRRGFRRDSLARDAFVTFRKFVNVHADVAEVVIIIHERVHRFRVFRWVQWILRVSRTGQFNSTWLFRTVALQYRIRQKKTKKTKHSLVSVDDVGLVEQINTHIHTHTHDDRERDR